MANRRFKVKAQFDSGVTMNGQVLQSLANPSAASDAIAREYVESRSTNLVTNGSGLMGDNYNFSSFTFDAAETHGGAGSFLKNVSQQGFQSDELIPIDPEKAWRVIGWGKSGDVSGANFNAANKQYFGIAQLDIDGLAATPATNQRFTGSTDTTLALDLINGATTITLTDATGWHNGATAAARHIAWWPYTNGKGYTWPNYTYTRNVSASNTWAQGGITGNVITLAAPWAGGTLLAGTKVRNAADGGSSGYKYIAAANISVPNAWTRYEGYLSGQDTTYNGDGTKFQVGTAYIRLLFLVNYHAAADNNIRWSDLSVTDLSARNFESAAVFPGTITTSAITVSGSGKTMVTLADTGAQLSGVTIGGDTNLYRNTADMLATDDRFLIKRALATDIAFSTQVGSFNGVYINADGKIQWSDAAGGSTDTNLYRSAADSLKTDDALQVALALTTLNGQITATRSTTGVGAFAAYITGGANPKFKLTPTTAGADLEWGDGTAAMDVRLYRSAADQLQTDDKFVVNHPSGYGVIILTPSGFTSLSARVQGESNDRVSIEPAASRINFGSGSATVDTNLYRSAADTLKTDDNFQAASYAVGTTALASTHLSDSAALARLASPIFTGTPTLPTGTIAVTQTAGDNTTAVATTAFVAAAVATVGSDPLKANLASPTFTGTPSLPTGTIAVTQTPGNNTTAIATTAFVTAAIATVGSDPLKANLASPTFTGTVTTPAITVSGSGKTMVTLADTGAQTSGLTIGGDTNLYRSAADTLKTDDAMEVTGTLKVRGAETSSRVFAMAMC